MLPLTRLVLFCTLAVVGVWGVIATTASGLPSGGAGAASPLEPAEQVEAPVMASTRCALCHSNSPRATAMRDAEGRPVAPHDLWGASMMANAARDPLWRAVLSAEVAATPSRQAQIEAICLGCHAPMAAATGLADHDTGSLMHVLECESPLGTLARDGVSCTTCHAMSPEGLGTEASFSAGFALDAGQRLFGPHESPFTMPMRHHTGFTPTYSEHIRSSALCGSCHTLETDTLAADGRATGQRLLEQAPYLEWRNSAFSDEGEEPGPFAAGCQDCHVPTLDVQDEAIRTRIARNPHGRDFPPVQPREPFGRHVVVGGNTLVLGMLRDHADELGVQAPTKTLDAAIEATREQLRTRSASVAIESARRESGRLLVDVRVENHAGHKLPTAHPTRRAWLRLLVRDADGELLFASGAVDASGRILGADGRALASELAGGPIPPHLDVVRSADEVASYEAVMADADGAATHTLLRGASWLHDDRLLPRGWSAEDPEAERTAPVGVPGDANFVGGSDRVRYELALDATGALSVEVTLLYQTFSARWASELFVWPTPEVEAFRRMYEASEQGPEVLASTRVELEG